MVSGKINVVRKKINVVTGENNGVREKNNAKEKMSGKNMVSGKNVCQDGKINDCREK